MNPIIYLTIALFAMCKSLERPNRLGDVLRNNTFTYNSTKRRQDDNFFKKEARKFLGDCGVEIDDDEDTDNTEEVEEDNKSAGKRRNYGDYGRYNGNYDNQSNESNNGRYNKGFLNHNNYNERHNCRDHQFGGGEGNYGNIDERTHWRNYGAGYDRNNEGNYGMYGNNGRFPMNGRRFGSYAQKKKRASSYYNNQNEDSQCISQCIFGYLDVLDDSRVPSETLVVKWIQDHYSNDLKRIRTLREARRCFARLASSDTEDGCEFSKSLSKCLNLELE